MQYYLNAYYLNIPKNYFFNEQMNITNPNVFE